MKIDRSDWAVVSPHFDRLAQYPPRQRQTELARLNLGDRHRRLITHLLEQLDRADSLGLDHTAPDRLGLDEPDPDAPQLPDWQGQRLGPWQVDEIIGRGGMSVIYRGHRADGEFEKQVAIKVLNRSNLIADGARLKEEVRILARLEHPGIARLIDSGSSEAGHSFLVMELVHGQPLDAWCRERGASPRRCVALIAEAAEALEYAHGRQVIHCDIKPPNLLVRREGRLCVVDFGIAALLQRQTDAGRRLYCSPAYTAPERFRRALPDTSQDVYSLGAVLGELLGDRGDRDLQAICERATAREPARRYRSMTAFRADLAAWQDRRPVTARDGGRLYLMRRWFRRHSLAASLGLLLVSSLGAGAAAALWQAQEARSEAARAVAARDFLVGIFESADPAVMRGEDPTASELLRRGAARVRADVANQPRLLAELLQVIGRIQLERGLIADAVASLEDALALTEVHAMPALRAAALSHRGLAAYEAGSFDEAVTYLRQAHELALATPMAGIDMDRLEVNLADMLLIAGAPEQALEVIDPVVTRLGDAHEAQTMSTRADALRVKGAALHETGQLVQALDVLQQALALQASLDRDDILLAKIENDLGVLYWDLREFESAAAVFERSLRHKQRVFGQDHPQTLSTLGNLAGVNMARGDHAGAESAWRRSLAALERLHDAPHPDIAYTWGMLAWSHYMRDDFTGAMNHLERGLEHRARLPDQDLHVVAWLAPLRGLVLLELDRPGALPELQQLAGSCADLDALSELQQRLCLARRLLETDPAADCGPDSVPAATSRALSALPARWQAVHALLHWRCASGEVPARLQAADPSAPAWLLRRLPDSA